MLTHTLLLLSAVHHPSPTPQVAEAKAAGVPVQIAVARSVTDVQQKVPLNPQVRPFVGTPFGTPYGTPASYLGYQSCGMFC
jgi:hypothetical protein